MSRLEATLLLAILGSSAATGAAVEAQEVAQVRYTAVREHELRRSVRLLGTVEALRESTVAGEVAGLVVGVEFEEGDRVERGDVLIRLQTRDYELRLEEARGRMQESQARLELAQSKLARARELFSDEIISRQDLDDAVSEYTAWQGREVQSHAEVDRLQFDLERSAIRAPFAGVVVRKHSDVGQWLAVGGAVLELVALDLLDVRVDLPERYYRELREGEEATVRFEALPGFVAAGRSAGVIPRADPQARTFPVKVRIANRDRRIGIGMLASVELPVGERTRVLIVPKDAVLLQGASEVVYRIGADDTVEAVPVTTGLAAGAWISVDGPLSAGDRVITRGNERLRPGLAVAAAPQEYPAP